LHQCQASKESSNETPELLLDCVAEGATDFMEDMQLAQVAMASPNTTNSPQPSPRKTFPVEAIRAPFTR
jgi:hypothetical protein